MGPCERGIVAYAADALLRRYRDGTMVVFPAANILRGVMTEFVVRRGQSARSTPFCPWIDRSDHHLEVDSRQTKTILHPFRVLYDDIFNELHSKYCTSRDNLKRFVDDYDVLQFAICVSKEGVIDRVE